MKQLEISKEFETLIPPLTEEEFDSLEQSVIEEGCREAIICWAGIIIDGHNRYNICTKHNIEFKTIEKNFNSEAEARIWIRNNQLSRRNLSDAWKIELALQNKEELLEIGKKKKIEVGKETGRGNIKVVSLNDTTFNEPHSTRKYLASSVGVATGKLAQAEVVKKKNPKLWEKAKAGKITIGGAYKEVKNIIYKEKEAEKKDISSIVIDKADLYSLHNCDILNSNIEDYSLDAIIADPPYPYEFIDVWSKLAQFASTKLKDGGVLIAMSGQSYLPEVYNRMNIEGLNYYWTCCIKMTVAPNLYNKRLQSHWKPLLFYVKGKYNKTHIKSDVYTPEYKDTLEGQKFHKWGQSIPLMKSIIEDFTYAGETICDPFMGGGSTIIAGMELKRNMIGIELNKEVYENTCRRLSDYVAE